MMIMRLITPTTHRSIVIRALCITSRSDYLRSSFSSNHLHIRSIALAVGTKLVPTVDKGSLLEKAEDSSPLTKANIRSSRSPQPVSGTTHKSLRNERFEQTLNLLSTRIGHIRSKGHSLQVRSSTWLYLFNLATCSEQLECAASNFSQFVESGRVFRDEHVAAFVRRCVELRCLELALNVFSNRPAYRMDLTLTAARQLLYDFHELRQFSNMVILAALFPRYNLPALSSDPISCALFLSACLREANISGSEPAWTVAETFLPSFRKLLSQTLPMPVPVEDNRFLENRWMKDAMLSVLHSLVVRGDEARWVKDWCHQSQYNLSNE